MSQPNFLNDNIEILYASLVNLQGYSQDIRYLLADMTITGSIFSHCMSGTISLLDGEGFIDAFPITGEELFEVRFRSPESGNLFITKTFAVYNITGRKKVDTKLEYYTLNLISLEGIVDMMTSVDQTFVGMTYSEIIKSVFDNYIYNSTKKVTIGGEEKNYIDSQKIRKSLSVEGTKGTQSVICNGSSPFSFIQQCVNKSQSEDYPDSDFVFYEDRDEFTLTSISYLLEQPSREKYRRGDHGLKETKALAEEGKNRYQYISQLEYNKGPNIVDSLQAGRYGNKVHAIDTITKRFQTVVTNYHDKQSKESTRFKNLNKSNLNSTNSIYKFDDGSSHSQFLVNNIFNKDYTEIEYMKDRITQKNDRYIFHPDNIFRTRGRVVSKFSQLQNYSLTIAVGGNSNLKCGDIIDVELPMSSSHESFKNKIQFLFGNDKENKFLITSITHNFIGDEGRYYTILNIAKDSYFSDILKDRGDKLKGLQ